MGNILATGTVCGRFGVFRAPRSACACMQARAEVTPPGFADTPTWRGTPHTSRARGLWPATPSRLDSKNIKCAQTTLPCS